MNATAVNKMMLPIDPNFECHDVGKNLESRSIIHDVIMPDLLHCPRKLTTVWTLRHFQSPYLPLQQL